MSDLSTVEMRYLERLLVSSPGYILDFSNPSFRDFIIDSVQIDIYAGDKYEMQGTSKANRLRCFCDIETGQTVGVLLGDLIRHHKEISADFADKKLLENCERIVERLLRSSPIGSVERLDDLVSGADATKVLNSVKDAINRNEPEMAIDRLHAFYQAFARERCATRGIGYDRLEPLHGVVGKFVKLLKAEGKVESSMAVTILKESGKVLDDFSNARNNHSPAHPNPLLSNAEATMILHWVRASIEFLQSFDSRQIDDQDTLMQSETSSDDDLPF